MQTPDPLTPLVAAAVQAPAASEADLDVLLADVAASVGGQLDVDVRVQTDRGGADRPVAMLRFDAAITDPDGTTTQTTCDVTIALDTLAVLARVARPHDDSEATLSGVAVAEELARDVERLRSAIAVAARNTMRLDTIALVATGRDDATRTHRRFTRDGFVGTPAQLVELVEALTDDSAAGPT